MNVTDLDQTHLGDLVELLANVDGRYFHHTSEAAARRFLETPEDVHLLGWAEGHAVAFGMLRGWAEGFENPSLGLAVRRDRAGRGYGTQMMSALEERARHRGAKRIRLRVHPDNQRARRLYERRGYRESGTERGELVMVLDLE